MGLFYRLLLKLLNFLEGIISEYHILILSFVRCLRHKYKWKINEVRHPQNWWRFHLPEWQNTTIIRFAQSGRGAARLARLHGVQEVGGSNPLAPTAEIKPSFLQDGFIFISHS